VPGIRVYDVYPAKVVGRDKQIEAILTKLKKSANPPANKPASVRQAHQPNAPLCLCGLGAARTRQMEGILPSPTDITLHQRPVPAMY
jgi:hypothetical protein